MKKRWLFVDAEFVDENTPLVKVPLVITVQLDSGVFRLVEVSTE
jgi:hypothetical protein